MKTYHVEVVSGNESGGLAGPSPDLNEMLDYTPGEELRDKTLNIMETEVVFGQHQGSKLIYTWRWDIEEWTPATRKLSLVFGATARPLAEQLHGLGLSKEDIDHWQRDADAITRLLVRGYIRDGEADRARKKLVNSIAKGG